ncbi:MAG: HlyD family efflux transporter periplasmic adaptor subunit [Candidatus Omnitrophica bacterium]|nr:HlyD family efflux transporter periplasmic adaptor subunit [Candidatus Omnitrophota bacterium]
MSKRVAKAFSFFALLILALGVVAYQFSHTFQQASFPGVVFGTEVEISSRTQGKILRVEVEPNSSVRKGEVLAEVFDEEVSARIKAASDELKDLSRAVERARADPLLETQEFQAREKMTEVQAEIAALEVTLPNLVREIANASATVRIHEDQLKRAEKLFEGGAILITELEGRRLSLGNSRQALDSLRANLEQENLKGDALRKRIASYRQEIEQMKERSRKAITDMEFTLRQARGELDTLLARRSEMLLIAPQDGVVSRVWKSVGEVAAAGEPILNIYTGERLWAEIYPLSRDAGLLRPGDKLQVLLDPGGWVRLPARVQGILPVMQSEPTNSLFGATDSTHAVVLVEFDDLEKAKSTLRKGQKITATLVPHGSPGG